MAASRCNGRDSDLRAGGWVDVSNAMEGPEAGCAQKVQQEMQKGKEKRQMVRLVESVGGSWLQRLAEKPTRNRTLA